MKSITLLTEFTKLENEILKKKCNDNDRNALNEILINIFIKMIKFYYSNIHIESNQMHIGLDSIMSFIFYRLSHFTSQQLSNYCLQHKFIRPKLVMENANGLNFFQIITSKDAFNRYNKKMSSNILIDAKLTQSYIINCISNHSIKYTCSNYAIAQYFFKNSQEQNVTIPFSVLRDPNVYISNCSCYVNKFVIKMYIIKLEYEMSLLIIHWPSNNIYRNNNYNHPFNLIYNFLIMNSFNFTSIIKNSVKVNDIKTLALPLFNIYSKHKDIHVALEDMPDFKSLFIDRQNNHTKCKNFSFKCQSELFVNQTPTITYSSNIPFSSKICLLINNPFLYLIFDKDNFLLNGGIFDGEYTLRALRGVILDSS